MLGYLFHVSHCSLYNTVRSDSLSVDAVKEQGKASRVAIHLMYGGGILNSDQGSCVRTWTTNPLPDVEWRGPLVQDIPTMFLTFTWRPAFEKDSDDAAGGGRSRMEALARGALVIQRCVWERVCPADTGLVMVRSSYSSPRGFVR